MLQPVHTIHLSWEFDVLCCALKKINNDDDRPNDHKYRLLSYALVVQQSAIELFRSPLTSRGLWNTLPRNITSAPSLTVFRKRLKTHLFNRSFPKPLQCPRSCFVNSDTIIDLFTYLLTHFVSSSFAVNCQLRSDAFWRFLSFFWEFVRNKLATASVAPTPSNDDIKEFLSMSVLRPPAFTVSRSEPD